MKVPEVGDQEAVGREEAGPLVGAEAGLLAEVSPEEAEVLVAEAVAVVGSTF